MMVYDLWLLQGYDDEDEVIDCQACDGSGCERCGGSGMQLASQVARQQDDNQEN